MDGLPVTTSCRELSWEAFQGAMSQIILEHKVDDCAYHCSTRCQDLHFFNHLMQEGAGPA